jgi:type IV pilus assembly protein PilB
MVVFDEEKQEKHVSELRKEEEEELAQVLSAKYGVNYIDLTTSPINLEGLRLIDEKTSRANRIGVFDRVGQKIKVACVAPENTEVQKIIEGFKAQGLIPTIYMTSTQSLEKIWTYYKDLSYSFETKSGALNIANEEIQKFIASVKSLPDLKKLLEETVTQKQKYKISHLLELMIAGALALGASDVHIEPEEKQVRIRYRLDGVLVDVMDVANEVYHLLLSRLKLLAGMKLNLYGAQDGRFSIIMSDTEIEIRASVLPSTYAEAVVLRVLNPNSISVGLEDMGIHPKLLAILNHEIDKPEGMILTTGPTGSGKTTALYAFLRKVYTPALKVITIENPIEYHLKGIVQTQTSAKDNYTFLEGLRAALRQDPDVIMVGEIRDGETAEIAVNAALTGHLVFSTLHTNNAAGTFPRLINLGINPKVLTSALSVSMAQRLMRRLCPDCKKEVAIEGRTKTLIDKTLATVKDLAEYLPAIPTKIYEPTGCDKCNHTGFKGRVGIYEAILRSPEIEQAVKRNPSERDIWKAAENQKILNMKQDGVIKILQGITSMEELERVVNIEDGY